MTLDPSTLEYSAIVAAFRQRAKGKFRLIDWSDSSALDVSATSDLPSVQVRPSGRRVRLGARSCSTVVENDYSITLRTGELTLANSFFPTEWLILQTLFALQYGALDRLRYNNRAFVETVDVSSSVAGITDPIAEQTQLQGWASQWTVTVQSSFSSSDLGVQE